MYNKTKHTTTYTQHNHHNMADSAPSSSSSLAATTTATHTPASKSIYKKRNIPKRWRGAAWKDNIQLDELHRFNETLKTMVRGHADRYAQLQEIYAHYRQAHSARKQAKKMVMGLYRELGNATIETIYVKRLSSEAAPHPGLASLLDEATRQQQQPQPQRTQQQIQPRTPVPPLPIPPSQQPQRTQQPQPHPKQQSRSSSPHPESPPIMVT